MLLGLTKSSSSALAGVARWTEDSVDWDLIFWTKNQKVAGSIPCQDTCLGCGPGPWVGVCERQLINISLKKKKTSNSALYNETCELYSSHRAEIPKLFKKIRVHTVALDVIFNCVALYSITLACQLFHQPMCICWLGAYNVPKVRSRVQIRIVPMLCYKLNCYNR